MKKKQLSDKKKIFKVKRIIIKLPIVLVVIALVIILLVLPFFLTLYNFRFYTQQYNENKVFDKIGEENAILATYNIFSFFKCRETKQVKCGSSLDVEYNQNSQTWKFSDNEKSHLKDVKNLIFGSAWVFVFFLLVFIFYTSFLFIAYKRRKKFKYFLSIMSKVFLRSGIYLLIIVLAFGILSMFFEQTFHLFHIVFFPQGNFSFPADSLLKTLYPDSFFMAGFKRIINTIIVEAVTLFVVGLTGTILLRKTRTQNIEKFE